MNNIDLMNYWFDSAEEDYETMKYMFEGGKYTWCLFIGHLVIEKMLKGMYAKNNSEEPTAPKIHNLIMIAQKAKLEVPLEIREDIQVINTFNISARYDDYKKAFAEKCTKEYTESSVNRINNVRNWILNLINASENNEENGDEL